MYYVAVRLESSLMTGIKDAPRKRGTWKRRLSAFGFGFGTSLAATVVFEVAFTQRVAHIIAPWLDGPGQISTTVRHAENKMPLEPGEISSLQVHDVRTGRTYAIETDAYSSATLPPGEYRVEAYVNGMFAGSSYVRVNGRSEARALITAPDQARLQVTVHGRNGRPLSGARVEVLSAKKDWPWRIGKTNEDGIAINPQGNSFSLSPTTKDNEEYTVRVTLGDQQLATKSVRLEQGRLVPLNLTVE